MRLTDFLDAAESGVTEMTGRIRRGGDRDDVVGRFGGIKKSYPELAAISAGPKQIAAAIRRGKGRTFETVRGLMETQMSKAGFEPARRRSPGRPTVAPHEPVKPTCMHCHGMHTTNQHRFHGVGSFHRTHLWAFNPPADKPFRIGQPKKIFYLRDQGGRQGDYYHIFTRRNAGLWTHPPGWVYFPNRVAVIR
jgi:hypothetical protein